jgi:glycosyltransferase involved in cell wall biosynthesis
MKIYMLTNTNPNVDGGGGGLQNQIILRVGSELGHDITVYTELDQVPEERPDLYWFSNTCGKFSIDRLMDMVGHTRYMVHDDAYMTLCPQPTREYKLCFQHEADSISLLLEERRLGNACPEEYPVHLDINPPIMLGDPLEYPDNVDRTMYGCHGICRYYDLIPLLTNCTIFSSNSPMHSMIWAGIFPQLRGKVVIMDPPIPTNGFTHIDNDYKVPNTYVYVGTIAKGKGFDKCAEFVRGKGGQLIAIGDVHHTINMEEYRDVAYYGRVPYELVPNIIRRCQYLIHLPVWPEPQGRIITEGLLMRCAVIANSRVGALTFPWLRECCNVQLLSDPIDLNAVMQVTVTDIDRLRCIVKEAPYKYWHDVEAML